MIFEILTLLSLGFIVGLSGAIIPGPLLAFTIFDTSRKRRVTGHLIVAGHVIWEFIVILAIFLGLGWMMMEWKQFIYMIGGAVLAFMGLNIIKSKDGKVEMKNSKVNSSLIGGIFYTAFNPTQPTWWATAGLALLLNGIELMGVLGVAVVTAGHWLSDFTYYVLVSFMVHQHERYINPYRRTISIVLGLFMISLGVYFLLQGIQQLTVTNTIS